LSNILHFPSAGAAPARDAGHLGSRLLSEPPPHAHAVQFYDDEPFLLETVGFFMRAGLAAGNLGVIIATPAHTEGILSQLGQDVRERALAGGELLLVDADAMLARFMRGDELDESAFEAAIERVFESLFGGLHAGERAQNAAHARRRRVRAFGEMVDLLWKRGNPAAALRLEEYWNRVTDRHDLVLLCGYGMRNFYKADDTAPFGEVCRLHTHVMPTEHFAKAAGDVFERLREISVLEQRARSLESEVAYREVLEGALRATIDERARAALDADTAAPKAACEEPHAAPNGAFRNALSKLFAVSRRLAWPLAAPREVASRAPKVRQRAARARLRRLLARAVWATRDRLERSADGSRSRR
jgi:hypothetical protein